jgi:transposase
VLARHCRQGAVHDVDEFRISQMCPHCNVNEPLCVVTEVRQQPARNEEEEEEDGSAANSNTAAPTRRDVRGLKFCNNCHRLMNRDENAATNILHLYCEWSHGRARPAAFARGARAQPKRRILLSDAEKRIASTRARPSTPAGRAPVTDLRVTTMP